MTEGTREKTQDLMGSNELRFEYFKLNYLQEIQIEKFSRLLFILTEYSGKVSELELAAEGSLM